jgi:hypothetical protein
MFSKKKGKKKKQNKNDLTTYDKFNLPLRTGSVIHQTSREARSWIRMAKDAGLI